MKEWFLKVREIDELILHHKVPLAKKTWKYSSLRLKDGFKFEEEREHLD